MKKYFLIGLFGFLGAILRFLVKSMPIWNTSQIAFGTLTINLSGSFILGLFLTLTLYFNNVDENIKAAISVGFLGAFTTFSTFSKEAALYILNGNFYISLIYVLLSIVTGVLASFSGVYIGEFIINKYISNHSKENDDIDYEEEIG